ncbi:MAG: class B sortase [Bacilli bacterium]|nr:class B sortase [Bacilli bacterium]
MTKREIYIFLALMILASSIIYITRSPSKDKIIKLSIPIKEQKQKNEDIVGRLYIKNTKLNIDIVKGKDNDYYLTHDINKNNDIIGTPFLDCNNNIEDKKIIIYGKNSQTIETPFHILEQYLEKNFLDNNPYINIDSKIKEKYKISSIIITTDNYKFKDIDLKEEDFRYINTNSIYKTNTQVSEKDKILILETNYYKPINSTLFIIAKKIITN